jgi:hypothetical protein
VGKQLKRSFWGEASSFKNYNDENFLKKSLTNLFIIFSATDYLAINFISLDSPHFILG